MPITIPNYPLPADLPTNWQANQIVAPDGTAVGLDAQHGYNYLMSAVNAAQTMCNDIIVYGNSVTADDATLVAGSIVVSTSYDMQEGTSVKFTAPCNSEDVTVGVTVDGVQYEWLDTLSEPLAGVEGLFTAGTIVGIILDRENLIAYLVNAAPTKGFIPYPSATPPTQRMPGALYFGVTDDFSEGGE